MLQIVATDLENDLNDSSEENSAHPYVLAGSQVPKIHCRLVNVEPIIALKNLKANYYGSYSASRRSRYQDSEIKSLIFGTYLMLVFLTYISFRKVCHYKRNCNSS